MLIVTLVSGCGRAEGPTPLGTPNASEVGEVTVVSDDSRATVSPVCVEDIPADLTTCAGAPANLGQLQLDQTRKATVQLPTEVATGGYRLRVNGAPLPDLADVLHDKAQPLRVPVTVVQEPGETVLTVEALSSFAHPRAVWQFLLADPAGPPA